MCESLETPGGPDEKANGRKKKKKLANQGNVRHGERKELVAKCKER